MKDSQGIGSNGFAEISRLVKLFRLEKILEGSVFKEFHLIPKDPRFFKSSKTS